MFAWLRFLVHACRRSHHCAYCGELGIKSQMRRARSKVWVCDAFCEQGQLEKAA